MTQPIVPDLTTVPAPAPEAGATVPVRSPDGTIGTIPAANIDAATKAGFTAVSAAEIEHEQSRPEFTGLGGKAAALSMGLARTVSFGLSDRAAIEANRLISGDAGAEEERNKLASWKEFNPEISLAGELGGFAVDGPLSVIGKGVGAAGKALGMLKSGAKAGEYVAAGASAGARIAQTGIRASVQGAIEGAAIGAGQQISEDALGDHETTAEKIWVATQKGGLFGATLGGAIGAAGQAIGEGAGLVSSRLRPHPEAAGEVEPLSNAGVEGDLKDFDAKLAEHVKSSATEAPLPAGIRSSKPTESLTEKYIARQADPAKQEVLRAYAKARETLSTADDVLEKTTKRATAAGDELLESVQATRAAFNGESKSVKMSQLVDSPEPSRSLGALFSTVDSVRGEVKMLEEVVGGEGRVGIRRAQDAIDNFDRKMVGTIKQGAETIDDLRAGFVLADRLKQAIGRASGFGRESFTETQGEMRKIYEVLRGHLEDTSLYGKAGEAQATMNKGTTDMLARSVGARSAFVDATESVGGDIVLRADPARMKSYLGNVDSVTNDLKKESIERFVAGHEAQLDSAGTHWPLDAQEAAQVEKGKQAIAKFRTEMAAAERDAALASRAKKMAEQEALHPAPHSAWLPGIGVASDAARAPMRTVTRLVDMQRTLKHIDEKITAGVDGFLSGKAGAPAAHMGNAEAAKLADEARKLTANPPALLERVGRMIAGLNESAPKVATALSAKAIGSLTWLSDRAPRDRIPMATFTPQFARQSHSDAQVASFARAHRAFDNPIAVLDDMKHGAITREGVEYLRDNAPKLYAQIQREMIDKLATATEPLPYEKRMQLSAFFEIPGDPTLDKAFIAALQATKVAPQDPTPAGAAPGARQGGARSGKPGDTKGYQTESDRIAAR